MLKNIQKSYFLELEKIARTRVTRRGQEAEARLLNFQTRIASKKQRKRMKAYYLRQALMNRYPYAAVNIYRYFNKARDPIYLREKSFVPKRRMKKLAGDADYLDPVKGAIVGGTIGTGISLLQLVDLLKKHSKKMKRYAKIGAGTGAAVGLAEYLRKQVEEK